jgi:hypothetical protein
MTIGGREKEVLGARVRIATTLLLAWILSLHTALANGITTRKVRHSWRESEVAVGHTSKHATQVDHVPPKFSKKLGKQPHYQI